MRTILFSAACLMLSTRLFSAEPAANPDFERGYYLETHDFDFQRAIAAYERALDDPSTSENTRAEVQTRLAGCKEEVAAADFAKLMPEDAVAYIETNRPGKHIAELVRLLGLVDPSEVKGTIPLDEGLVLPLDFTVSPALLRELSKVRGAAFALTSLEFSGDVPPGLFVANVGDSDLLRGLLETGIQFVQPAESIGGFDTYNVDDQLWLTATNRMILASHSRQEITAALDRLDGSESSSLASRSDLKELREDRAESMVFAYVHGESIRQFMRSELRGKEAMMVNAMLDPESFKHVLSTLKVVEGEVELQTSLKYEEGHRALAYGLMQTGKVEGRAFRFIPKDASVVAALGMNPFLKTLAETETVRASQVFSLMDVGREVFGNVTELGMFALPPASAGGPPLPEVAVIMSVNDGDKSVGLWEQMLSLPSAAGMPEAKIEPISVAGHDGKRFRLPDAPPVSMVRLDAKTIALGTEQAIVAAIEAGADKREDARNIKMELPFVNKMVFSNVGKTLDLIAAMEPGDAAELHQIKMAVQELKVSIAACEQPNELIVRVALSDLPNLRRVAEKLADKMVSPSDR